jgi:subtilisin family serine protease
VPLRRHDERSVQGPGISAVSALAFSAQSTAQGETGGGVNFIEISAGHDTQQLQTALAGDPHVRAVSRVPVRYLAARPQRRAAEGARGSDATIAATPPNAPIMWNLAKIFWEQARAREGFRDADSIQVAVLDTGIDQDHPELRGQIDAYHWQQPDLSRPVSEKDIVGHGTHVSGTIAALSMAM